MNIIRLFRLGLRVAEWATPRIKEWHAAKHFNRNEGKRLLDARCHAEAEKHLAAALNEKHSQKHRAEIHAQLSKAQLKQNKIEAAEQSARSALSCAKDHTSQWAAAEALATIQIAQGKTAAAIETLGVLESEETKLQQPDLKRLAKIARWRGKLLLESGRSMDGLAALDQSAKLSEKAWGAEDVETAHSLAEIGAVYSQRGDHKEAQKLLGQALKIYKVTSGYNSEEASRGLHNLAISLEASGDYDSAAAEYERFVAACERQVGCNPKTVASAKIRLGALYVQGNRWAPARELLLPVISMLDKGPNDQLREALQIMAIADEKAGRRQDAAQWRERAEALAVA